MTCRALAGGAREPTEAIRGCTLHFSAHRHVRTQRARAQAQNEFLGYSEHVLLWTTGPRARARACLVSLRSSHNFPTKPLTLNTECTCCARCSRPPLAVNPSPTSPSHSLQHRHHSGAAHLSRAFQGILFGTHSTEPFLWKTTKGRYAVNL